MRTFQGKVSMDFKTIVPEQFLTTLREQAQAEDATPFLKMAQARHPENDDEFIALCLSNGIRSNVRTELLNLYASSGLGGTASPPAIEVIAAAFDHDAPLNPDVIQYKRGEGGSVIPAKQGGSASLGILGLILLLAVVVACGFGYINNIVHLIRHAELGAITLQLLLEAVGVFVFPLGIILGWLA